MRIGKLDQFRPSPFCCPGEDLVHAIAGMSLQPDEEFQPNLSLDLFDDPLELMRI
jgi:hypothetical protein